MNVTELKSYLEMVLDLELQKSICHKILSEVQSVRYEFEPIQLIPYEKNYSTRQVNYSFSWKKYSEIEGKYDNYSLYGAIIGGVVGFSTVRTFTPIVLLIFPIIGNFLGKAIAKNKEKREQIAIKNEVEAAKRRKVEDLNHQVQRRNTEIMAENTAIRQKNIEREETVKKQNDLISNAANELQRVYSEISNTLQTVYSSNIIYQKYRNITAIAAIYEYIASGRCAQLEGHGGAYDTFEKDSKMDVIASHLYDITGKLKTVISNQQKMIVNQHEMISNQGRIIDNQQGMLKNQERINDNQERLYASVNNMNNTLTTVSNGIKENTERLNEIGVNTALTAYTTQVIERNQYYERSWRNNKGYYDHIRV